ncbi:MAG: VIT domain-containing protein [Myxococcota bacterium]
MTGPNATTNPRKRLLLGLTALAVIGATAALVVLKPWKTPPPVTTAQLAAKLELAAGEVLLETSEGDDAGRRVLSGTPLPEGARLRTGPGARALVRLGDGARIYLDEGAAVQLQDGLVLHEGRAWLDAPRLERGQTPTPHRVGDATVALSEGGASLELRDEAVTVYVAEGLAIVTGPGGRTEVAAGERVRIEGSSAPAVQPVAFWDDWTGGMGDRSGLGGRRSVGSGSLYAVDRRAAPGSPALPLQIQSQSVQVVMRDELAETKVDQRFFNPSGRDVEGYYWFTIPEGSHLVSFALETNGQLVEGEIVERKEAAATYEAAVQRANDPALLEWIDEHTVRARIFPVPSLGTRRIVVRYQQLLTEAEGKLRYSYPLAGPVGKQTASIEDFSLAVDLGELSQRYDVATLAEARLEDNGQRITMRRSGYTPRADFQLELTRKPGQEPPPLRLSMLEPGGDQARYVMVRYTPTVDFDAVPMPKGQVVVVVDTSAAGDPAEYQTRLAVAEAFLRSLSTDDEFAVMSADVRAQVLYPDSAPDSAMAPAEPQAVSAALERLAEHGTGGATDLGAIFELALARVHGQEQPAIVYIGDGLATSGERGGDALAERLRRSMTGSRARLFTVGVGQEVDEPLLSGLARIGGGINVRVQTPEQAIVRALELSGALKTPTITDLRIDLGEGLDDVFTSTTGKLSRGQGLVLLARTHHDLPDEVTVYGRLGGKDFEHTHPLTRTGGVTVQVVPRLWAAAYIERLLGDSRGPEAVRGKILSLGLEYGLMSPYTSVLALENEQAYAASGIQRRQRTMGGVRLTANLAQRVPQRVPPSRPDTSDVLAGFFSAPFGCQAQSPRSGDNAQVAAVVQEAPSLSTPAASTPASPPPPPPVAAEPTPEPAPESAPMAQPKPTSKFKRASAEDTKQRLAAERSTQIIQTETRGASVEETIAGLPAGGKEGDGAADDTPGLAEVHEDVNLPAKPLSNQTGRTKSPQEDRQRNRPTVRSNVVRNRSLPCSDASARGLVHRRILWRKRLRAVTTMTEALEIYEASAGSCEIRNWKDQRTFLGLLQGQARTEANIDLMLGHFGDESDAARYLARALLRRLVDPALVAAVDRAMFGAQVDWSDVDRRVVLALTPGDKLEIVRGALARAPGDPEGELRMLELLVASDRLDEAVSRGRRLREQGLMTPALAQSLGEIMVAHGQTEEAQRLFSELVEFDPASPVSRRLLGDIFLRHGWYDSAYRQYEDLIELDAEDPLAAIRLARAAAGTGRVDEALRTLRKIAAGEGRPGADDPRRFARLHAAAYLAELLQDADDSSEIPRASIVRELRRLQLFDGPSTWTLLVWEDLQAQLVMAPIDPAAPAYTADALSAADTGLFARQAPPAELAALTVRHAGEVMNRAVKFTKLTIRFDGKEFSVDREQGELPARQSRLIATPDEEPAEPTLEPG